MEITESDRQEIEKLYFEFLRARYKFVNRLMDFYLFDDSMVEADLNILFDIIYLHDKLKEKGIIKNDVRG